MGILRGYDEYNDLVEKNYERKNKQRTIPDWTEYFLFIAFSASLRSPDAETQHGCVITDEDNRVLGIGYNGWPKKMPDNIIPNYRPDKYAFVIHAEANAIYNCSVRPIGGIAYVTGESCLECVKTLYQNGIKKIVQADRHGSHLALSEHRDIIQVIAYRGEMEILSIDVDLDKFAKSILLLR